jgi:hypothetical protein
MSTGGGTTFVVSFLVVSAGVVGSGFLTATSGAGLLFSQLRAKVLSKATIARFFKIFICRKFKE